jgi:hypothetical protein
MSTKFYHFGNFQADPKTADFIFDVAHALTPYIDQIPHLAQQAYHGVYGYTPSVGDLSAVPLLANAGNYGKWINKAKDSYKAHADLPRAKRIGMTAWDTGAQVLRDSEGWGNPIVDTIGAAERNVRGVYDKSKELGRRLTPAETLAESKKAAIETAKSQVLTRPKFLAGIPGMVKGAASGAKEALPGIQASVGKIFRRKPKLALG